MKNMIPGLSLPYRTKCVDKNPPPPEKVYPGNRLRLPSPHRDTLRAALMPARRRYRGFGCSLMHSFYGRIRTRTVHMSFCSHCRTSASGFRHNFCKRAKVILLLRVNAKKHPAALLEQPNAFISFINFCMKFSDFLILQHLSC